jgi:hypothetical protein
MKALSLKQPWAELILQGRKKIELRKWNTNFRGDFLIHSSKIPDLKAMRELGFDSLPLGCIVGRAKLVGVKRYFDDGEFGNDKELHMANNDWGKFGFILNNVERLEPLFVNGKLNFWNFEY